MAPGSIYIEEYMLNFVEIEDDLISPPLAWKYDNPYENVSKTSNLFDKEMCTLYKHLN